MPLTSSFFPPPLRCHHHYRHRRIVRDVLSAPTVDQVDVGSCVEVRHDGENAQTVRHRYNDGAAGASSSVGASAFAGGTASSAAAAAKVAETTMTFDRVLKVREGT